MGGNLFTHAMSEAEVQAHKVRLKLRVSEQKPSLLELLQRQRGRALLATTEPLGLQRSATKSLQSQGSITRSVVKAEK